MDLYILHTQYIFACCDSDILFYVCYSIDYFSGPSCSKLMLSLVNISLKL